MRRTILTTEQIRYLLIILLVTASLLMAGCRSEEPDEKRSCPEYKLPYEIKSLSVDDIPACMSDGTITRRLKDISGKWEGFVEKRSSRVSYQQQVQEYSYTVRHVLQNEYITISDEAQRAIQEITDNLIKSVADFNHLEGMTTYIVKRKNGKGYLNAATYPGAVFFGKDLYDICMMDKYGGVDGLAMILAHELGHNLISFEFSERESKIVDGYLDKLPDFLQSVTRRTVRSILSVHSDSDEARCDLIAIKALSLTDEYCPEKGLNIYRYFKKNSDPYQLDWLSSHPAAHHREPCLRSLIIEHRITQ